MLGLREPLSLLALNVRSWRARPVATGVAVVGFMIVVLVFAGIFFIESGYRATTDATGSPNVALVMLPGAHSEIESSIPETSQGPFTSKAFPDGSHNGRRGNRPPLNAPPSESTTEHLLSCGPNLDRRTRNVEMFVRNARKRWANFGPQK